MSEHERLFHKALFCHETQGTCKVWLDSVPVEKAFPTIRVAFAGAQRWQLKAAWHLPSILFLYHFNYINWEMGAVTSTQGVHLWILQVLSLWFQTLQSITHKEKNVNYLLLYVHIE